MFGLNLPQSSAAEAIAKGYKYKSSENGRRRCPNPTLDEASEFLDDFNQNLSTQGILKHFPNSKSVALCLTSVFCSSVQTFEKTESEDGLEAGKPEKV